jgi:hypothetical protein
MPQNPEVSSDKDRLQDVINRSDLIINGLEHNRSWELVVEDLGKQQQKLDDSWQYVTDEKKWLEYRITKLATMKLLSLIDDYKNDKGLAQKELFLLENPDKAIQKDYDNA